MNTKHPEPLWQRSPKALSFQQLSELAGLSEFELRKLVEGGVFAPLDKTEKSWIFSSDCAVTARTVHRLRVELDLDANDLTEALTLLERVRLLEAEQQVVQATQVFC